MSRRIDMLQPAMQVVVREFCRRLDEAGIRYTITETYRDQQTQDAYYAQGRAPLEHVNRLRKAAGLWPIDEEENSRCITWTRRSNHTSGRAIDIAPLRGNGIWWTAPADEWEKLGVIGEACGLVWGGRWDVRDYPHYELPKEVVS